MDIPLDSKTFLSRHSMDMKFTYCDDRWGPGSVCAVAGLSHVCVCVCGCAYGKGMGLGHGYCIAGYTFVDVCHCVIPSVCLRGSWYHIWWFPVEAASAADGRAVLLCSSLLIAVVCTQPSTYVSGS